MIALLPSPAMLALDLQVIAALLTLARLLYLGLYKRQPALLAFLILNSAGIYGMSFFSFRSHSYFWAYLGFEVASVVVEIAVVRELFSLTMQDYPGIRTAARWILYASVALGALVTILVDAFFWNEGARSKSNLVYVHKADESVKVVLALILICLVVFLSRFPLHLARNKYVSSYFFSAIFLADAASKLVDLRAPHLFSFSVDMADLVLLIFLFIGWAAMLRSEEPSAPKVLAADGPREEALILQLELINRTLTRAGKK